MAMGELQRRQALIHGTNQELPDEERLKQMQDQAMMDAAADKLAASQGAIQTDSGGVRADSGFGSLWGFGKDNTTPSSAGDKGPSAPMSPREAEEARKKAEHEEMVKKYMEQMANM